ncbi:MAG: disulfide bond formation protein B [Candidatus Pacebacteria bacterium]|nr:disulfide bond formation protein B [Candidatus Paceibacterota bacterium]
MSPLVEFLTQTLSVLTIVAEILILVIAVSVAFRKKGEWALHRFLRVHAPAVAFFISLFAVLASLFYSEFAGFPLCSLCWVQRVFMFPLPFILLYAWIKHSRRTEGVALLLALIGSAVATYNWYVQFGGNAFIPCPASGESCAKIFFIMFGYVTIPVMSLSAFALITATLAAGAIHRGK